MKNIILIAILLFFGITNAQNLKSMKLNAGIITQKIEETKTFYTEFLEFGIKKVVNHLFG